MKTMFLSFIVMLAAGLGCTTTEMSDGGAKAAQCCGDTCCDKCPSCCAECCDAGCCTDTCCDECPDCCE